MTSICFYTPHYFYLYHRELKGFFWVKRRCCNSAEFIFAFLGGNSREDFALVEFSTGFCLGGILAKDQRFHLGSYRLSVHWGRWRFSFRGVDTLKRYAKGRPTGC